MPVNTTAIAITSTNAAITAANVHKAKVERCKLELQAYDPHTATTAEMQSYADCVQTIYPEEMTGTEILVGKFFVVFALLSFFVGVWYARTRSYEEWPVAILLGIGLSCLGPLLLFLLLSAIYGVYWVFTG